MDGNGTLFGTLSGNTRDVVHKFTVDLPKKHGRGGQSALRFSRLRDEKRHNYVRKVAEHAVQHFITNDRVNVSGLVLAGSADFKTELNQSDIFDPRLAAKVIKVVDVSYGGENGFNQAIELAAESLANVKFVQEKKLIQKYFDEISVDSGKYCFGIEDTLKGLEMGAVETLIVWENLDITRYVLRNAAGGASSFYVCYAGSNRLLAHRRNNSLRQQRTRKGPREVYGQIDGRGNGHCRRTSIALGMVYGKVSRVWSGARIRDEQVSGGRTIRQRVRRDRGVVEV
jgi:peptide chain release factor 1